MDEPQTRVVALEQRKDFEFDTRFEGVQQSLRTDEPPPLGGAAGPDPTQLLAAAVGNCLTASLLFALRKHRVQAEPLAAHVVATIDRNDKGRLRINGMVARLRLGKPGASLPGLDRVLAVFQDFCTVTQSLHTAIPVTVSVFDSDDRLVG